MATIEELQARIEALEAENAALKEQSKKGRPLSDSFNNVMRKQYPSVYFKCDQDDITKLGTVIRRVCFPRSKKRLCGGQRGYKKTPAPLTVNEMNDKQYARYCEVFHEICKTLADNVFIDSSLEELMSKLHPGVEISGYREEGGEGS